MFWANFRAETRLGGFAATEDFVRRYLREGRSLQVQLLPRGVGFLFLILYPAASSSSSSSSAASASSTIFHAQLCHTPSFTHNFVTHHFVTHHLSHTFFHIQPFHTHTTLSHTILHAQLCHTPSFTHTTLSHTIFHTPSFTYNLVRRGTWRRPPLFCVAGVALGDIHLRFTWQAWHWETSTFVLRGRRGTYGTGLALVARLGWDWSLVAPRHFA